MVNVRKSPKFRREGYNAVCSIDVPVIDLILGASKQVETIYGKKTNLNIPAGTQANSKIKIPLEGFYHPNTTLKGDFYV